MSQDPLLTQLASRCRTFSAGTGVSLHKIAKLVGVESSNFSNFINGKIGLSAANTIKLLQLLNLSKQQVEMKLAGSGSSKEIQLEHFQEYLNGKPTGKPQAMRVVSEQGGSGGIKHLQDGSGWLPREGTGGDPNDRGDDITDTPTATGREDLDDDLDRTLAEAKALHQRAIDLLDGYEARKVQKAKVQSGPSEGTRKVTDNADSSRPGSRPDKFHVKPDPKRLLAIYLESKEEAEDELALLQSVEAARTGAVRARQNLEQFRK